jgi:hypothetical protein
MKDVYEQERMCMHHQKEQKGTKKRRRKEKRKERRELSNMVVAQNVTQVRGES